MRKIILLVLTLCSFNAVFAKHIMGGFIEYQYIGPGSSANSSTYQITVTLFINCITGPTVPPVTSVILGVFDASSGATALTEAIPMTAASTISKTTFSTCLSDPPPVCYILNTYTGSIELPNNANGYILAVQNVLRVAGIINIENSGQDGIVNFSTIPGTINGVDYHTISSPVFAFRDTVVICHNNSFVYQFNASDPDGDTLTYSFGNGLNVGDAFVEGNNSPPPNPPFTPLVYSPGYSGPQPLGAGVIIDSATGIISGTAPSAPGVYVVAVYVSKWKNGLVISTTKKELQITVADCSLTSAALNPLYINCDNFTFNFQNESTSSNVASYLWNFGGPGSTPDTSTQTQPTYTYADTGTYTLQLTVSTTGGCVDTASATVKVYPGFTTGFTVNGSCYQSAFQFTDSSTANYGTINSWSWNFGDPSTTADTSTLQNPSWLYAAAGTATVTLAVTSSKGCSGTASKTVVINDAPPIYLPFTDTLICSGDTLPLIAESAGSTFSWAPAFNINDTNTATPLVYPNDTTVYTVTVKNKGCVGTGAVTVNVLQFITVALVQDTGICKTDSITLSPISYALSYLWKEAGGASSLSSNTVKYPKAAPLATTTYYVTANLGHCQDSAQETVYVSPYPSAVVSNDTSLCFGQSLRLNASTNAAYFTWAPLNSLYQSNTLTPLAGPDSTTNYLFTVRDTFYCTKSVTDTITVTVIPTVQVSAGDDTSVVVNQPLQLLASSNNSTVSYTWAPATYLNNQYINNPVAVFNSGAPDSITYSITAATPQGCYGTGYVTVRLFKTGPDIFVPSAFTPNGDGKNDEAKPVPAGIKQFNFFKIFNRLGQCVFQTSEEGVGWNGNFNGVAQPTATYIYMAQGVDYLGNIVFRKGTIVLVR